MCCFYYIQFIIVDYDLFITTLDAMVIKGNAHKSARNLTIS